MTRKTHSRRIWNVVAGILLAALSIPARAGDANTTKEADTKVSAGAETAPETPAANSSATPAAAPSLADVVQLLQTQAQEIEDLRTALRAQQELTASLAAKINAAPAGPAPSDPVSAATPAATSASAAGAPQADLAQRVANVESEVSNSRKEIESRLKSLGPFVFSGDIRLRAEPTLGGPVDQSQDRFRERYRLRFNADARLNDEFKGGFSLASGDLNTPISTNQTLGQYGTRKPLEIDRAYITYTPNWFHPLTLTGGKFAYPWFNTELVWDKDLNPEGAAEILASNTGIPVLKRISLVAFQSPFAENKRIATTNKSFFNTMVYGEQVQAFWQLGSRVKLSTYLGYYDWKYADSIASAVVAANSASPDDGLLPLSSTGAQNSMATVTTTNAITGVKTITSAQYASKFGILDLIAQFDIQTPYERWPITMLGDYAQNTEACSNLPNIVSSAVFSVACDPHARHAYWLEGRVGRLDRKGDWQFKYTRFVIQREAVLGVFNYSEIFPTSNVEMHRSEIIYQLYKNVQLEFNALIGRPLVNAGTPAPVQPLWERLQFDTTYTF